MSHLRIAIISLAVLLSACLVQDSCPPGQPQRATFDAGCLVLERDGGPAMGVTATCSGEATTTATDSAGRLTFRTEDYLCGFTQYATTCGVLVLSRDAGSGVNDLVTSDGGAVTIRGDFTPSSCEFTLP